MKPKVTAAHSVAPISAAIAQASAVTAATIAVAVRAGCPG